MTLLIVLVTGAASPPTIDGYCPIATFDDVSVLATTDCV